eukprot:SAG31_NODE_449_length_15539_cov_21.936658_11_plen_52_part_00
MFIKYRTKFSTGVDLPGTCINTGTVHSAFFKKIALYYGTICNTNSEEGSQK